MQTSEITVPTGKSKTLVLAEEGHAVAFQTQGTWEAYYIIVQNYFIHLSVIGLDFPP